MRLKTNRSPIRPSGESARSEDNRKKVKLKCLQSKTEPMLCCKRWLGPTHTVKNLQLIASSAALDPANFNRKRCDVVLASREF